MSTTELKNPVSQYKWTLAALAIAVLLAIVTYGFAAPALISAASNELVILGFILVVTVPALIVSLIIKAINTYFKERNAN